jgi:anionic cell wall polymer biosynthesis LytR-Cps2A-Psr (LCP) family protein
VVEAAGGQRGPQWLRDPRWLRWGVLVAAALVLVVAGVAVAHTVQSRYAVPGDDLLPEGTPSATTPAASPTAAASPTPEPGADIAGPLNILLVGIDPRSWDPTWVPNADAVLILHVPEGLRSAYLFSLPRDLLVDVPAFEPAGYGGGRTKLTHAMSSGSRVPGSNLPDVGQGFQLLAETVSRYTGIGRFDAGAVLNFGGFTKLVDALGGVDLYVDQRVVSEHMRPDGVHREPRAGGGGYVGPQQVYEEGVQHLVGWQALDYARQRYGVEGGDYGRQRHQQHLIKALLRGAVEADLVSDPLRLDRVLRAVGDALVFDGRGHGVIDYAFALRQVRPGSVVLVSLPGTSVFGGFGYAGEQLAPVAGDFLEAIRKDRIARFLRAHPELLNPDRPPARP